MTFVKIITACSLVASLGACEVAGGGNKSDKTIDLGFDKKHLSHLVAGVWADPNGCITGSSMTVMRAICLSDLTNTANLYVQVLHPRTRRLARSKLVPHLGI